MQSQAGSSRNKKSFSYLLRILHTHSLLPILHNGIGQWSLRSLNDLLCGSAQYAIHPSPDEVFSLSQRQLICVTDNERGGAAAARRRYQPESEGGKHNRCCSPSAALERREEEEEAKGDVSVTESFLVFPV